MLIRILYVLFIGFCSNIYAVDYIHQQDTQRCTVFSKSRDEREVLPFTKRISKQLTDHERIDYSRSATLDEREVIYKAMMGSVIVHGTSIQLYQKTIQSHAQYDQHFEVLQLVDNTAQRLWQSVQKGQYIDNYDQICQDIAHKNLLTVYFLKWFYEALESYRHELNYFGGTATLEWFQRARQYHQEGKITKFDLGEYSEKKIGIVHNHIHDAQGNKVAVLKPKPSVDPNYMNDLIVSLGAKALGLIDVINPAIPVRLERGGTFVIDSKYFDSIIEPFVGTNEEQLSQSAAPMQRLIKNVLANANKEKKAKEEKSFLLNLRSFAEYFENVDVPAAQRFADLQTFNMAIDIDNIVKLIAFWQVFQIIDMHPGNLLWVLNSQQKFSVICIDFNHFFGYLYSASGSRVTHNDPAFPLLQQARLEIPPRSKQTIEELPSWRLPQVFKLFSVPNKANVSKVQAAFNTQNTLRKVMYEFIKPSDSPMVKFYSAVDPNCTPFDPLDIRPLGAHYMGGRVAPLLKGYKEIKGKGIEGIYDGANYLSYQVRQLYDWVFSVGTVDELEKNHFFPSLVFPATYIWNGCIPFNLLFDRDYLKIIPGS